MGKVVKSERKVMRNKEKKNCKKENTVQLQWKPQRRPRVELLERREEESFFSKRRFLSKNLNCF